MVTGGFVTTALGVRLSVHSPLPSLALAIACAATWLILAARRGALADALAGLEQGVHRQWRRITVAIAIAAVSLAAAFHSFSATGSDASGYLSYTQLLAEGQLTRHEPLATVARWRDGPATLAPLGWRPALTPGQQVPTYSIGLPLLLTPFFAVGGVALASWVIALTLAISVVSVAVIAHRAAGPAAAVIAATWLATSPVALIQSMQVMSDVPVTAAWLLCWWCVFRHRPLAAGATAAIAILIRPNLAPLAAVPLAYLLAPLVVRRRMERQLVAFSVPVLMAAVLVGWLQALYFGSPMRSGYGTAAEIYSSSNVLPNAALYAEWLAATHGLWLIATPLALLISGELVWLLAFAALLVLSYLVYAVFESWTYLRFLLPALAIAMIGVSALAANLIHRLPAAARIPVLAFVVLALATSNLTAAREHGVFRFADRQARGRVVGERLAATLPVNTVIVSAEHSGTMRFYTGRTTLRWDLIAPETMPEALEWLSRNGYRAWVVLDDWEEEAFRARFPALAAQSIDHRPIVESAPGVAIRTRAWPVRRANVQN